VSGRVITYYKLKWAVFSFQPYKSPDMDGIMPIMLQQGFELLGGKLLMLLRASLALGYIPMSWRHTRVVFIPKPGKSLTQAKSLRPISLMSVMLKILEKLLDRHIRGGFLVEKPLHQNQFAYLTGMPMDTALFQVVQRLEKSLEYKEVALGAFLDIEEVFDNTSFDAIITAARERGLEETCCRWIRSMLEGRLVHTSLMGSSLTAKVVGGCPQAVLSPLLWNLVVDRLLTLTNDLGFSTFGYADDIVIIVQGKYTQDVMQQALNVVIKWAAKEGLNISPQKTAIVPFTKRKKTEGLGPLILYGKELEMLDRVKYLDVILDSKLNWNQHLQKIIRKTQNTFALVRRTCGRKWGLRPGMVHWLYTRVIRPSILHGALVWWPKVTQKTTKTQLGRIQRMACLTITGAMKMTPTAAMELILNLTLLDLLIMAGARMTLYRLHKFMQPADSTASSGMLSIRKNVSDHVLDMQSDHTIPVYNFSKIYKVIIDVDYWRNNDLNLPEDIIVWFTDGSRMDSGTGAGVYGIRPNRSFSFSLGKFASVFQTEIYAIIQCAYENIRRAYKNKWILIFSDSQSALKVLSGPKVTPRLVVECQDALLALANHNEVTLMWVPGHQGIFGIEEADKLARQG